MTVTYVVDGQQKSYASTQSLMVILTGRQYSEAEINRFLKALKSLDERISREKADRIAVQKIAEAVDANEQGIGNLRAKNLSYGEIVTCLYTASGAKRTPEDILEVKRSGQKWEEFLSVLDLGISDLTATLKEIEASITPKPKQKSGNGKPRSTSNKGWF